MELVKRVIESCTDPPGRVYLSYFPRLRLSLRDYATAWALHVIDLRSMKNRSSAITSSGYGGETVIFSGSNRFADTGSGSDERFRGYFNMSADAVLSALS